MASNKRRGAATSKKKKMTNLAYKFDSAINKAQAKTKNFGRTLKRELPLAAKDTVARTKAIGPGIVAKAIENKNKNPIYKNVGIKGLKAELKNEANDFKATVKNVRNKTKGATAKMESRLKDSTKVLVGMHKTAGKKISNQAAAIGSKAKTKVLDTKDYVQGKLPRSEAANRVRGRGIAGPGRARIKQDKARVKAIVAKGDAIFNAKYMQKPTLKGELKLAAKDTAARFKNAGSKVGKAVKKFGARYEGMTLSTLNPKGSVPANKVAAGARKVVAGARKAGSAIKTSAMNRARDTKLGAQSLNKRVIQPNARKAGAAITARAKNTAAGAQSLNRRVIQPNARKAGAVAREAGFVAKEGVKSAGSNAVGAARTTSTMSAQALARFRSQFAKRRPRDPDGKFR